MLNCWAICGKGVLQGDLMDDLVNVNKGSPKNLDVIFQFVSRTR